MKYKNLLLALSLLLATTGVVLGISLYLQPGQSVLGIVVIIGAALLGAAGFIGGLNDTYDLVSKLFDHNASSQKRVAEEASGPKGAESFEDDTRFVRMIWDKLEPDLQDALSITYNLSKREGKRKIRTRHLFAAIARLSPEPFPELVKRLPIEALGPIPEDVKPDRPLPEEPIELSACVKESLRTLSSKSTPERKISSTDVFVDIAKHGTGSSVARLREHGVTAEQIEHLVKELGLDVIER